MLRMFIFTHSKLVYLYLSFHTSVANIITRGGCNTNKIYS
jgi:hypothetical protein